MSDNDVADPTDLIYVYFRGLSCLPSMDPSTPCTTGGDLAYVVNVTTPAQISATIKFAKEKKIRLIIKNTGHDIEWLPNYTTQYYTGPAIRVGAGVSVGEFYQAAENHDVTIVGAGGYSAGGGHSPVDGIFGMAADNIVELTAVLPNGTHVTITDITSPELFWVFRGGGGAAFGVVTSMTVKAQPKIYATVSTWGFSTGPNVTNATFWKRVEAYIEYVLAIGDAGSQAFAGVSPASGGFALNIYSHVAPNKTIAGCDAFMSPFFSKLDTLGLSYQKNTTFHISYLSRWQHPKLFKDTLSALQKITDLGYGFIFYAQRNVASPGVTNAINPAYRTSSAFLMVSEGWTQNPTAAEVSRRRYVITKVLVPILKSVTPGSGTHMNEADIREDNGQQGFFGSNYPRLWTLNKNLDPESVFWAKTAVGSEDCYIQNNEDLPEKCVTSDSDTRVCYEDLDDGPGSNDCAQCGGIAASLRRDRLDNRQQEQEGEDSVGDSHDYLCSVIARHEWQDQKSVAEKPAFERATFSIEICGGLVPN
ncbi:FAD-binding domain-containing protein [Pleomassaria siparia CBS 279.74]|uniref:FAD-binding domain-containing protein n=1 Tax=Pleomassaria siparia CBS 279.74 TaxID=1314801 RepID=A0A6G1JSY6_9PLEO|nr:FAD-binding domain-containing protein [Pleomassaria siparia CBS 279.74]